MKTLSVFQAANVRAVNDFISVAALLEYASGGAKYTFMAVVPSVGERVKEDKRKSQ